ncbi:MotA/TolQ/ExbB proton channel family protein [Microvirga tunisiensis]|uniref:MotA/TolQ/ExbB proton channel family protein n=2 Tax=Pannonibacter tanglangensis TaxID=2750084 RepID=A0A7X5J9K4_9HYPH|nr:MULTISPECIES: MotA/TolQ/ExbB proton channel family protein [unclassified Pannonibacter]NBN65105.1 MotA/TolQ/ExbB proton channel family protein [Pannonibacter sp. XCT-34]NBN79919.1 MotA/TolQ/ExbB proton channel family protein [Pannonibacter sp. XCT-53]
MLSELSNQLPEFLHPVVDLVDQGGSVVGIQLVMSVIALALIFAKLIQFALAGAGRFGRARRALGLHLDGDTAVALATVAGHRGILNEVMALLLKAQTRPGGARADLLREDIERICLGRIAELRAWLRPLDLIAQTAPLLGLYGTVLGMIDAFQAMQGAGAAVDPSVLAGGIWVALLTTAVGLAISIPVSAVVSWFDGRIERTQQEMEAVVTAFFTGAAAERPAVLPAHLDVIQGGTRHAV